MSKQMSETLLQALLAARKDPITLAAAELKVHVFSCPGGGNHSHFSVTSPYVENRALFEQFEDDFMVKAVSKKFEPKNGDYLFRQSMTDGTKCTNEDTPDAATVEFLLVSGVVQTLLELNMWLSRAFMEWPTDVVIKRSLERSYSQTLRRKIWHGTDANPIRVRVIGEAQDADEARQLKFNATLSILSGGRPRPPKNDEIVLNAFRDDNPCSPVVRKALAAYATDILNQQVEPEIAPKIVQRVQLALDTLATRLAREQARKTEATTTAPTATSGAVAIDSNEEVGVPTEGGSAPVGDTKRPPLFMDDSGCSWG